MLEIRVIQIHRKTQVAWVDTYSLKIKEKLCREKGAQHKAGNTFQNFSFLFQQAKTLTVRFSACCRNLTRKPPLDKVTSHLPQGTAAARTVQNTPQKLPSAGAPGRGHADLAPLCPQASGAAADAPTALTSPCPPAPFLHLRRLTLIFLLLLSTE